MTEDIVAWLSEVENDGEEKHRSETSIAKFWRQKSEIWNRCSGYESRGMKWYWKETRSLLSMESKSAVFERRQVQFPARQWWACRINTKNHSILWATTKRQKCVEERDLQRSESIWVVRSTAGQRLLERYLHPNHLGAIGMLPNVSKFGNKWSFLHRKVEEQPDIKPKEGGDKNAVATLKNARQLGCVSRERAAEIFIDFTEGHRKSWDQFDESTIHKSYAASRRHLLPKKGPSLGKIQVKIQISASPYAMKFEDRSQEEIERQERCARGGAWRLAKNIFKLTQTDRATFFSPTNEWSLPAPSAIKLEEREFVVDSGASMHMLSRKDLNSAWLETVKVSKNPTTAVTANGEVQTQEEATAHVKEFDLFVTVKLLEDISAVLSLGKRCEDHGYSHEWTSGQKPHLIKVGRRTKCSTENYVPIVVPGLSTGSSSSATPTSPTSLPQDKHGETCGMNQQRPKNTNKNADNETVRGNPFAWSARMVRRVYGESCGWQCSRTPRRTREIFSWIIFRAARKSDIEQAQSLYSLSEGPTLRHLHEDQNYKGSLQKTCLCSRAQSGQFWWLDNSRSQNSQWREWIAWQSPICRSGTRFGNAVVTLLPMWNKNFPGDPEEPDEVPGADEETQSHSYWQFPSIWQILWRSFLESFIVRRHRTDRKLMGMLREQCAELRKGHLQ